MKKHNRLASKTSSFNGYHRLRSFKITKLTVDRVYRHDNEIFQGEYSVADSKNTTDNNNNNKKLNRLNKHSKTGVETGNKKNTVASPRLSALQIFLFDGYKKNYPVAV